MNFGRIISVFEDAPEAEAPHSSLRVFQSILALHLAAEHINLSAIFLREWDWIVVGRLAAAAAAAGAVLASRRAARPAFGVLALLQLYYAWLLFPMSANHTFLELYLAGLCAGLSAEAEEDGQILIGMLRWTAAIILFHSGLQKLLYGYYFRGEMLAFLIGHRSGFTNVLGLIVPEAERARLTALTLGEGQGPYRTPPGLLWIVSNLTYLTELLLPAGLILRKTRAYAAAATVALILAIEVCAHEFYFGMLFMNILLLFAPPRRTRHAVWLAAAIYLYLVLVRMAVLPGPEFN